MTLLNLGARPPCVLAVGVVAFKQKTRRSLGSFLFDAKLSLDASLTHLLPAGDEEPEKAALYK